MTIRGGFLKRVAAGGAFGLYMAHLLYFLNPQIDITPIRLAVVTAMYALLAGLIFGTLLWLLHLLRVRLFEAEAETVVRTRGFGFMAVAALVSTLVYWGHVLLLRVYLPREAVRNLSKAAGIVALAAVVLFVLWLVERTAQRKMSRTLFAIGCALVVVSSFFLHQRRERYRAETIPIGTAVVETREARRMVVVAIRNLPFDWLLQLMGEDLLPFFSRAREESFLTRVEPFPTTSPKTLWASLATGKLPHAHGVTGRFSYRTLLSSGNERFLLVPYWVGFKAWGLIPPVQRISAQLLSGDALPLWTLFERLGYGAAVVNWPSIRGGVATSRQATLRVIAFNGLADARHASKIEGNRLPPRSTTIGEAIRAYLEQVDRSLSQLEHSSPDATLIIVSPSGPRPPPLPATPLTLAAIALTQEDPGSSDGFLLIRGPNVAPHENPAPVAVTDLVPTVLFAAGLPVARDMDGRAIAEAFTEQFVQQNPISLIPTYQAGKLVQRRLQTQSE